MRKQLLCIIVALCVWGCQSQEQVEPEVVAVDSAAVEENTPVAEEGDFAAAGLETGEVENFLAGLKRAVASDDRRKVASLIAYPLTVDVAGEPLTLRDASEFTRAYDTIVTNDVKQAVSSAEMESLFANWKGVSIEQGMVWFSGVYEVDAVEEENYVLKITGINLPASDSTGTLP